MVGEHTCNLPIWAWILSLAIHPVDMLFYVHTDHDSRLPYPYQLASASFMTPLGLWKGWEVHDMGMEAVVRVNSG